MEMIRRGMDWVERRACSSSEQASHRNRIDFGGKGGWEDEGYRDVDRVVYPSKIFVHIRLGAPLQRTERYFYCISIIYFGSVKSCVETFTAVFEARLWSISIVRVWECIRSEHRECS